MADPHLIIGNKNYSSWSLRPWIFMREKGISFTEHRIALFTETMRAELEPYFSNYKVPVLLDDSLRVWDSLAILEYLADKYPQANGWPRDMSARAQARAVSAEMHSSFSHLRRSLPMNCRRHCPNFSIDADTQADVDRIRTLWRHCRAHYGAGGPWLFGDYSIADAMYAPVVVRFAGYDVRLEGVEREYAETVLASPHMVDWIAAGKAETEIIESEEI